MRYYSRWYSQGRKLPTLVCVGTLWSCVVTVATTSSCDRPVPCLKTVSVSSFPVVHHRKPCALSVLGSIRGGGGGGGGDGEAGFSSQQPNRFEGLNHPNEPMQNYYENYEGYNQRPPMYDDSQQQQLELNDYAPSFDNLPYDTETEDPFPPETVQQRVERWKAEQREQGLLTSQNIPNSGKDSVVSLLSSVSKGGRCMVFFFLMWRDIHLFEVVDQSIGKDGKGGALRALLVTPLVFLFVTNLGGALVSLSTTTSTSATKRRLKAILKADMLVELILLLYYTIRLTIAPSKYISREVYVANIFHSIIFGLQCHAFTRVSWDDRQQAEPEFRQLSSAQDNDKPYITTDNNPLYQEDVAGMDDSRYYPSQEEEDTRQYFYQTNPYDDRRQY